MYYRPLKPSLEVAHDTNLVYFAMLHRTTSIQSYPVIGSGKHSLLLEIEGMPVFYHVKIYAALCANPETMWTITRLHEATKRTSQGKEIRIPDTLWVEAYLPRRF